MLPLCFTAIKLIMFLQSYIKISYSLINTAQQTLSDLDKSIDELSMLVENLRHQSLKLTKD